MKRIIFLCFLCAFTAMSVDAQGSFEKFKKKSEKKYEKFKQKSNEKFEKFRNKHNKEYAEFVRKAWKGFQALEAIPIPEEENPVPPVVYPKDEPKPIKDTPKPYEEIIPVVKPEPQPEPVEPIEEEEQPVTEYFAFSFFNTNERVRLGQQDKFRLNGCNENSIGDAWEKLSEEKYNPLINDCLSIRKKYDLCDWAYLEMLQDLSAAYLGKGTNEATLLTAFLYCQSGYKMRLARGNNKLYLLYASKHSIYNQAYFTIDNESYYPLDCKESALNICEIGYPKEKAMSLYIGKEQKLDYQRTNDRMLVSKRYPDVQVNVCTNKNLIDFYDTYPSSEINGNFMTRWAMYANTPLNSETKQMLYPALRKSIDGLSQNDAANKLLNFVQTAFVYEYDDKVWGHDRAFFAEETLYYPYCDCEDRSILFSRLVRDLMGLKVILVYYPGHLATAVCFTENVTGDYLSVNGSKYTVCDPTYINAPVGNTMPDMDNRQAKVILLE